MIGCKRRIEKGGRGREREVEEISKQKNREGGERKREKRTGVNFLRRWTVRWVIPERI